MKLNTSTSEVLEGDGRWKKERDPMYTGGGSSTFLSTKIQIQMQIQIQIQRERWEQETQCIQEEAVPPLCQRLMACSKHISIHHILTYSHTQITYSFIHK